MVKAQSQQHPATGETAIRSESKVKKYGSEQLEIQVYLSKLKELVPHMPKNRKVSKLEVIQHVIDYICDLQWALESHPAGKNPALVSAGIASIMAGSQTNSVRQPLGVLPPTPNSLPNTCAAQEIIHPSDKSIANDCDVRTIPC